MNQLIVVGVGIKSVSHLSQETIAVIQNSARVLYLVNEPFMKEWIDRESKYSYSLDDLYFSYEKRIDAYKAIKDYIISETKKYPSVCVVFYGHPVIFANSALWAVMKIKDDGGNAVILPAISSLDCLFADLAVDPGNQGCFSVDTTDFLIFKKKFDTRAHLVLWQVGNLGTFNQDQTSNLAVLQEYLLSYYKPDHLVCFYEASQYPSISPRIDFIPLSLLANQSVNSLTTMYVPPVSEAYCDFGMIKRLGMDITNFILS